MSDDRFPWPLMPRGDGRVELLCPHGIGHPSRRLHRGAWRDADGVHSCDLCCSRDSAFTVSEDYYLENSQIPHGGDIMAKKKAKKKAAKKTRKKATKKTAKKKGAKKKKTANKKSPKKAKKKARKTTSVKPPVTGTPAVYLEELRSDIQKGFNVQLAPKTLLVGPNGAGKSTIIRAAQGLLSNKVDDLFWRATVAQGSELVDLGDGSGVTVTGRLSNGEESTFKISKSGRRTKAKFAVVDPDAVLPLRTLREAVLGSAEKMQRFFLRYACGDISADAIKTRIQDAGGTVALRFSHLAPEDFDDDPVGGLLSTREAIKKAINDAEKEARAQEKLVESTSQGLEAEATDDEMAVAKQAYEDAKQTFDAIATSSSAQADAEELASVQRQIAELKVAIASSAPAYDDQTAVLDVAESCKKIIERMQVEAETHGHQACFVCGGVADPAQLAVQLDKINGALSQLASVKETNEKAAEKLAVMKSRLEAFQARADTLKRFVDGAQDVELPNMTLSDARNKRDAAEQALSTLRESAKAWSIVKQARKEGAAQRAYANDLKSALKVVDAIISDLLDSGIADFTRRVQEHLPADYDFGFSFGDDDKTTCRFGLIREGRICPFMSDAERAVVSVALGSVIADFHDGMFLLTPEDRDIDAENLTRVMSALAAANHQVILTSTKPPSRPVEGWTVIDVTEMDVYDEDTPSVVHAEAGANGSFVELTG